MFVNIIQKIKITKEKMYQKAAYIFIKDIMNQKFWRDSRLIYQQHQVFSLQILILNSANASRNNGGNEVLQVTALLIYL